MRAAGNIPGIPTSTLFKFPGNSATRRSPVNYSVELSTRRYLGNYRRVSDVATAAAAAAFDHVVVVVEVVPVVPESRLCYCSAFAFWFWQGLVVD